MNKKLPLTEVTPEIQILIDVINLELEQGAERERRAAKKERIRTYWNIGEHIKEHLLHNLDRAEYGAELFDLLAEKLAMSKTVLYLTVQFYEEYPKILPAPGELNWTHITSLLAIPEKETRKAYEEKILRQKLSTRDLIALIKKDKKLSKQTKAEVAPILPVKRGVPFIYKLKKVNNILQIDLGFNVLYESPRQELKEGSVVQVNKQGDDYELVELTDGTKPQYTYKAYLLEIVDGDTIWVYIDLGFKVLTKQKLRLKGINTREIESPEGKLAKDFLASRLENCEFIAVKVYWRDKFNRYLADIFYDSKESDLLKLTQKGKFLNQELLDEELAVKY
jgi:endonuclease YncB( thermonuclease family)